MEPNELIDGLINEEFSDISIYTGEARLFTDKIIGGHRIAETFAAFAREETEHARALMRIIGKTEGIQSRKIEVGSSLRKCLEMHVRREATAVTLYKKLLPLLTAPDHKMIIKGIIAQEAEHLLAAKDYLMKIREANEK
jgi:rubrerythrin